MQRTAAATQKTTSGPVHLGLPEPKGGCDVCGAPARGRETAHRNGDLSKVSDVNGEMCSHREDER
ncbi:hypothetical protein [Streptomyces sp. NPDC055085]